MNAPQASLPAFSRLERWLAGFIVAAAAVQAYARHDAVSADGVSYLDLAGRLIDSDWTAALDRYWSPLYPVLLAVAGTIAGATRSTEAIVAHALNLVILIVALVALRSAVRALRDLQARRGSTWVFDANTAHGTIVLYAAFACGALRYTNVGLVTPDLCVLAVTCAIVAMLLRAEGAGARGDFAFGALLMLGYGAKAAMLPLAIPALGAWALVRRPQPLRAVSRAAAALAVLAAPYIGLLSAQEGKLTTGETGPINLAWYVGGVSSNVPDPQAVGTESIATPWERVVQSPATYAFPNGTGTYPAWADPTHWQRGLRAELTAGAFVTSVKRQFSDYYVLFGVLAFAGLGLLAVYGGGAHSSRPDAVAIALVAFAPVAMYMLVHIEPRFLGGSVIAATFALALACARARDAAERLLVGLPVLGGVIVLLRPVAIPSLRESLFAAVIAVVVMTPLVRARSARIAAVVALFALLAPVAAHLTRDAQGAVAVARGAVTVVDAAVADALADAGVTEGSRVGSVGASTPAAWARRASVRIAAEVAVRDTEAFWRSDPAGRADVIDAMRRAGASAIVGRRSSPPGAGWRAVPSTDYWVFRLLAPSSP